MAETTGRVRMRIFSGRKLLFDGILNAKHPKQVQDSGTRDAILEDSFNIERYINTQGAYRCHVEWVESKG